MGPQERLLLVVLASGVPAGSALRDVPAGECFSCEVTCFEDCALKFDREIIQMDSFLQKPPKFKGSAKAPPKYARQIADGVAKRLNNAGKKKCVKKSGCALAQKCMVSMEQDLAQAVQDKKADEDMAKLERGLEHHGEAGTHNWMLDKSSFEASTADIPDWRASEKAPRQFRDAVSYSSGAAEGPGYHEVEAEAAANRIDLAQAKTKLIPLEPDRESYYPVHPVAIGVFGKGRITLHKCLSFCLSMTCGCPGIVEVVGSEKDKHVAENKALDAVADTEPAWHYRPAKKKECEGKVTKGLYIDFAEGTGGWLEVCTEKFWRYAFKGDVTNERYVGWKTGCKKTPVEDMEYGCVWSDIRGVCEVGMPELKAPRLNCFHRYKRE